MGVSVLGPLEIDGLGRDLARRDRVVLSALVVAAGDPVSTEQLADALWGDTPPASWQKVVQGCVMRLRKMLGSAAIQSGDFGYRLTLTDAELDSARFERGLARAREALDGDDPERAAYLASEALGLWRGQPLADLEEWEPGRIRAGQLDGRRMDAEELFVEAQLSSGHAASVLEEARALVARAPFRERRWVLLATALHQSGRQAEALAAIQRARSMLVDELGLDPGRELAALELQVLRQDPSLAPRPGREVSPTCPYQGLRPYDAQDADSFFGRDEEVAAALRRLRDVGALAVVGPSGVGKSSLIRAGVVATLLREGRRVVVTTPGAHPVGSLTELMAGGKQTLAVDQAEEAITICTDAHERAEYFAAIAGHVAAGGPLVLSLRADHLGDLAPFPAVARIIEDGLLLLGPMGESALRQAIEGPARRAGLRLEPGLVDLLVRDVEGEPASLPLLSHVLRETWHRREGPTLTVEAYRSTGGVRHAVAQSAEALYESLDDAQRVRLRGLLLRLVQPSEEGAAVRTRLPRDKAASDEDHAWLLERLVASRLVSVDGDSVLIAHEALFREWPRLRGWLDDDVDGQRLFRHLAGAADAWAALGRPDSELYRGVRLQRTLEWRDQVQPDLDATERAFLDASLTLDRTEERAAAARLASQRLVNRRLREALAAVAVLLVLAMVAGIAALGTAERARTSKARAEAAAQMADARRAGAQALVTEAPTTSLLLAVAALQADGSAQAWDTLGAALMRNRSLLALRELDGLVSLTVSGDGAFVAVSDPVSGVSLFDTSTLQPLDFPDRTPSSLVRFSPDSSLLAIGRSPWWAHRDLGPYFNEHPVRLYDMPGGRLAAQQLGGWPTWADAQYALEFSQDGRRIVAAMRRWDFAARAWSPIGVVSVWDLGHRAKPLMTVQLPELAHAALSPDGRSVYVMSHDASPLRLYDVDSGALVRQAPQSLLSRFAATPSDVSPDGSTLAVAANGQILRFDARTLKPRGQALDGEASVVSALRYSPDGRLLLAAAVDGTATLWNATTGGQLRRFVPGRTPATSDPGTAAYGRSWEADFSSDGLAVFTGSKDLMKWDVSGSRELYSQTGTSPPVGEHLDLALASPDGRTVVRQRSGRMWFVDERTGLSTAPTSAPSLDPRVAGWSDDGRWFLAHDEDGALRVWDARTGRQIAARHSKTLRWEAAAFDDLGDRIYAVEIGRGALHTLDRTTLADLGEPVSMGYESVSALLPDRASGTVVVKLEAGSVLRVDPGRLQAESDGGPQGAPMHVGMADGVLPALSPDGTRLVGIDPDRQVRMLDLDTATWSTPATRADWDSVYTFVFSPDGAQVASAAPDRIRLWDGGTGEYEASLPLPTRSAGVSVAYLPDSSGLLVTTLDGSTWTVPTRTGTWVDRACTIAGRNLTQAEWDQFFPGRPYRVQCPQ